MNTVDIPLHLPTCIATAFLDTFVFLFFIAGAIYHLIFVETSWAATDRACLQGTSWLRAHLT